MRWPSSRRRIFLLLASHGLVVAWCIYSFPQSRGVVGNGQPSSPRSAKNSSSPGEPEQSHDTSEIEEKVDSLNRRLDSELRASNDRYEVLLRTTERDFHAIELFVLLGSLFVGVFVGWATYREAQQRGKDRLFYESRVKEAEQREEETHSYAVRFAEQQLSRAGEVVSVQIENMTKLGAVIDLMNKTFDKQLQSLTQLDQLRNEITKMQASLANVTNHYEKQYSNVEVTLAPFTERSRMDWPKISGEEAAETNRALGIFQDIPEWFLAEKEKTDRFGFAHLYVVLGQAAYHANQIAAATEYFAKSVRLYGHDYDDKHRLARAFCSHYLGLIDKNWCPAGLNKGMNLETAKRHLDEAWDLLKSNTNEFLTPVTLAEVRSYSSRDRTASAEQLGTILENGQFDDGIIRNLMKIKASPRGLDPNQSDLLTRALLIRGNLEYVDEHFERALEYYTLAHVHDGESAYALFSMAQATSNKQEKADLFREGLDALESSGALNKRETSSKLLAVAWAVVANHTLKEERKRDKYLRQLRSVGASPHAVGKREPLFFCPVNKVQVLFTELWETLGEFLKSGESKAA
jgi:tetratricopeptide (TPR) repeat protein